MTIYQLIEKIGPRFFAKHKLLKLAFNLSPMYRRSSARISNITEDLKTIHIELPLTYKNRNYVGSIFGGSLFAAVDPVPMVQLINLLGSEYVVWDKSAEIFFKRPAKQKLFATISISDHELAFIKERVASEKEIELEKITSLVDAEGIIYCEVKKKIYIAVKAYYKEKRRNKNQS